MAFDEIKENVATKLDEVRHKRWAGLTATNKPCDAWRPK